MRWDRPDSQGMRSLLEESNRQGARRRNSKHGVRTRSRAMRPRYPCKVPTAPLPQKRRCAVRRLEKATSDYHRVVVRAKGKPDDVARPSGTTS